jgi:hypothetical protein
MGGGLLLRTVSGSSSHIHQAAHLPLQNDLIWLWAKVTVVNLRTGRTIVTDMPVVKMVRAEINRANERGRPSRALEVAELITGLSDPDS